MELSVAVAVVRGAQQACSTQREFDAFEAVLEAASKQLPPQPGTLEYAQMVVANVAKAQSAINGLGAGPKP